MMTIHKYVFEPAENLEIEMPGNAHVFNVGCQRGKLCLWAMVDTTKPMRRRRFLVYGTGHEVDSGLSLFDTASEHIGTVQQGPFVWHVFIDSLFRGCECSPEELSEQEKMLQPMLSPTDKEATE